MRIASAVMLCLALAACGRPGEEVGEFRNDWLGNEVVVVALSDPKVQGVTCHLAHFDRGFWDRLGNGDWFTNPSNSSISCRQTGPIAIGDVERGAEGEAVFSQRQSLVFRHMTVRRIYDETNNALVYVAYTRRPVRGSAQISISTIALYGQDAAASTPAG